MRIRVNPRNRYLGTVPMLAPVTVAIPDPVIPNFEDDSGVSVDDSGMSVVTVVAHKSSGMPWWVWAIAAAGSYVIWGRK